MKKSILAAAILPARGKAAVIPWYQAGGIPIANCIAAYQPKGAASLAASYVNLANPGTYDAAPGTAPTWDAVNGWKFAAASSQYLITGVVPATGWSAVVKYGSFTPATGTDFIFGGFGSASAQMRLGLTASEMFYANGESVAGTGGIIAAATICLSYNKVFINGVDSLLTTGAWSGTANDIYIGCRNNLDAPNYYANVYIQYLAFYDKVLNDSETLATYLAINP